MGCDRHRHGARAAFDRVIRPARSHNVLTRSRATAALVYAGARRTYWTWSPSWSGCLPEAT